MNTQTPTRERRQIGFIEAAVSGVSHHSSPAGTSGESADALGQEGAGGSRDLGEAEDAETAQGTLPRLDLLVVCTRLGGGGAA